MVTTKTSNNLEKNIDITVITKIMSSKTVFSIDNSNTYFLSISKSTYCMISEGSCDPEDWSNNANNSAAHPRIKLHFNTY